MDTDQILDSVELMAGVDRDGARLAVDATCSPWLSGSAGRRADRDAGWSAKLCNAALRPLVAAPR